MFTSVKDRAVIVTGGSKGIGKGIARVFAEQGAHVLIAGRDPDALDAAAASLAEGATGRVETVAADVSQVAGCRRIAEVALELFGAIDVLCANAGIFPDKRLVDMTEEDVDSVMACNLKGTIFSVQACIPALEASGHGRVVLTSSITGPITGFPGWSHYGATKAAADLALGGVRIDLPTEPVHGRALRRVFERFAQQLHHRRPDRHLGVRRDQNHAAIQ